jgi:WD40 repeat protein
MEDPAFSSPSDDSDLSPQLQQNVDGDGNVVIANLTGGTAINKVVGSVIYNYYYREELQTAIDDADKAAEADQLPCPYRGLFHFGPKDAEYFFGRENFVEELVTATQTRSFIPLLGASGSGKSSVVLAGLVPKLQEAGHWQFTHFRPGADPFHALALALVPLYTSNLDETERIRQSRKLAGYFRTGEVLLGDVFAQIQQNYPTDRVLLIADQFEELYTLCTDEITRRDFLDKLLAGITAPTDRISFAPVLVATMRADFLGNALSYRPFADVLQNADLKLGPMNRAELTEVIEKPAQKLGVTFEVGLVPRILDAVNEEPGNLPLLEFALRELWQRRSGKQLTHAAYEAISEVQGALTRHADEAIDKISKLYANARIKEIQKMQGDLDPQACNKLKEELRKEQREQIQRIFVQLVRPGEGAEDTRRVAMKAELGEQSWSLVRQLADENNRLMVTNQNGAEQETVEIVHEALIRHWGELRGWMETDRVFRAWQERLRGAMRQWQETKQDEGSLLRGAALAEAEEQLRKRPEELVSESSFIKLSLQDRERIQQAEAAHRKREIRIARGIVGGSLVAVAVSSGFGWMAWQQRRQAELNLADMLSASALSLVDKGKDLDAFIPAIRAGKILQSQQASNPSGLNALQEALNHRSEYNRLEGHQGSVRSMSFSPDGKILASSSDDGTIKLWNTKTGKEIRTLLGHERSVRSISFSPNGKTLASISDTMIKLWNTETGKEIQTLPGHESFVQSISFSPDGKTLASSSDKIIKLWNVDTGKEIRTLLGHQNSALSMSFSSNGKTLATEIRDKGIFGFHGGTIKLWNVDTGKEIRTLLLPDDESSVNGVSFSPDGKTLATGHDNIFDKNKNTIKLWDLETGKEIRALLGHHSSVLSMGFSLDGKILATGSDDDTIKIWNIDTGKEIRTLPQYQNSVLSISFSPDGKTLATGGSDTTIKLWDLFAKSILEFYCCANSVSFSPDGRTLATGDNISLNSDNTIKLWNVDTGKEIHTVSQYSNPVWSMSFSPDGKTLAIGSNTFFLDGDNTTIKLWNIDTGKEIRTLVGHQGSVLSMYFSPNGKTLATGGSDAKIKIWNVDTGKEIRTLLHQSVINSVSFSPDGKILATGSGTIFDFSQENMITLWNADTGKEIRTLIGHQGSVNSVSFSPNGKTLATGGSDAKIKIWNVDTGKEIRTLIGHQGSVNSVSFSLNGKTLATGSGAIFGISDNAIKLWNIETGKEIRTLLGHQGSVNSVSFSPDGKTLATGSDDKTIRLWNLDLDSLVKRSCNWASSYLENNINISESDKHLCDGIGSKNSNESEIRLGNLRF